MKPEHSPTLCGLTGNRLLLASLPSGGRIYGHITSANSRDLDLFLNSSLNGDPDIFLRSHLATSLFQGGS